MSNRLAARKLASVWRSSRIVGASASRSTVSSFTLSGVVASRPGLARNASARFACSARSTSALNAFAIAAVRCSPPRRIVRAKIGSPPRTKQMLVR